MSATAYVRPFARWVFDSIVVLVLWVVLALVTTFPGVGLSMLLDLSPVAAVILGMASHILLAQKLLYAGYPFATPPTI